MATQDSNDPNRHQELSAAANNADDDGIVVPGSPPPLGSERTDVNPGGEAGVDELPGNEGKTPAGSREAERIRDRVPDTDPDNAERNEAPNPR